MGLCCSKPKTKHDAVPIDRPSQVRAEAHPLLSSSGLRVTPTFAVLNARNRPESCFVTVAEGRGYIFAALFQGLAGPASAALCKGACHEEYVAALKAAEAEGVTPEGGEAVRRAVSAVFTALEARLAAATDMAVATSGAVGVILVLECEAGRVTTGCVGSAHAFSSSAIGSFAVGNAEANTLTQGAVELRKSLTALSLLHGPEDTATPTDVAALVAAARSHVLGFSDPKAGRKRDKRGSTAGGARSARTTRGSTAGGVSGTAASSGGAGEAGAPVGDGAGGPDTAGLTEASSLVCQVSTRTLGPQDQHLVLASDGLLDLLDPADVAALTHAFDTARLQTLRAAAASAAAAQHAAGSHASSGGSTEYSSTSTGGGKPGSNNPSSGGASLPAPTPSTSEGGDGRAPAAAAAIAKLGHQRQGVLTTTAAGGGRTAAVVGSSTAAVPGAKAVVLPAPKAAPEFNLASLVMHQAQAKLRFTRHFPPALCYELSGDAQPAPGPASITTPGIKPAGAQPPVGAAAPKPVPTVNGTKQMSFVSENSERAAGAGAESGQKEQELRRDAGVLVLSLSWPSSLTSHQINLTRVVEASRVARPAAMYRWAMVRQLARVMWLRRKRLLAAWTGAARDMSMRAEIARREAEVLAWRHLGEAVQMGRAGLVKRSDAGAPSTASTASTVGAHVGVTPTKATAGAGVTGSARVTPHKGAGAVSGLPSGASSSAPAGAGAAGSASPGVVSKGAVGRAAAAGAAGAPPPPSLSLTSPRGNNPLAATISSSNKARGPHVVLLSPGRSPSGNNTRYSSSTITGTSGTAGTATAAGAGATDPPGVEGSTTPTPGSPAKIPTGSVASGSVASALRTSVSSFLKSPRGNSRLPQPPSSTSATPSTTGAAAVPASTAAAAPLPGPAVGSNASPASVTAAGVESLVDTEGVVVSVRATPTRQSLSRSVTAVASRHTPGRPVTPAGATIVASHAVSVPPSCDEASEDERGRGVTGAPGSVSSVTKSGMTRVGGGYSIIGLNSSMRTSFASSPLSSAAAQAAAAGNNKHPDGAVAATSPAGGVGITSAARRILSPRKSPGPAPPLSPSSKLAVPSSTTVGPAGTGATKAGSPALSSSNSTGSAGAAYRLRPLRNRG